MTQKSTLVEGDPTMVFDPTSENDLEVVFNHPDDHSVCSVTGSQPSSPY